MGEANNVEQFIEIINNSILPFIDYDKLKVSYNSDMVYAKGVLNRLHEAMVSAYGGELLDEYAGGEDGSVVIPGVLCGKNNHKLCLALLDLDLTSSGEHWGTTFICEYGIVTQSSMNDDPAARKMIAAIGSYDYAYTATIPCDIHVDSNRLPVELTSVLDDFRNHKAVFTNEQPDKESADLNALGVDMMNSFDFVIKMEAMIPSVASDSLQKIIAFAQQLDEEGSYSKSDYLRDALTEYDSATRQYGQDITRKLLDLSATFIVNPSKIPGAAMLLHNGVKLEEIPRMVISGKCDPSIGGKPLPKEALGTASGEKPSVLDKIRDAEKKPKKPRKNKSTHDKSKPEL